MDEEARLSGTPTATGNYSFTVMVDDNMSNYWDEQEFTLYIDSVYYVPGDVDGSESFDISDLVYLTDHMFSGGTPPVCPGL